MLERSRGRGGGEQLSRVSVHFIRALCTDLLCVCVCVFFPPPFALRQLFATQHSVFPSLGRD